MIRVKVEFPGHWETFDIPHISAAEFNAMTDDEVMEVLDVYVSNADHPEYIVDSVESIRA